jgi:hypothetical protein
MSQRRTDPESASTPQFEEDATMMVQALDPGLDRLKGVLSAENLPAMKTLLARCEVEHIAPGSAFEGFNYRGFVKNLRGLGKLDLGRARIYTLLTRHNAFLLSNLVAEELHDLVQGMMGLDLSDRATLRDGDRRRFLYKVESRQLERLRTIANENRMLSAHAFAFVDLGQFRQRLATAVVVEGTLDVAHFAATVQSVSNLYLGPHHEQYHQVLAGDPPDAYLLYVAPPAEIRGGVSLACGGTALRLIRE